MSNKMILRDIEKMRVDLRNSGKSFLPILLLDQAAFEEMKLQLDGKVDKRGNRVLTFGDGRQERINASTVIIVDDIE